MKEVISERLSLIIKKLGMNKNQLANALNFKNSVVGNVINMRNLPSFDFVFRLKSYDNRLDLNWLFTGEGDMFLPENSGTIDVYKDLVDSLKRENALLREKLAAKEQSNDCKNKKAS